MTVHYYVRGGVRRNRCVQFFRIIFMRHILFEEFTIIVGKSENLLATTIHSIYLCMHFQFYLRRWPKGGTKKETELSRVITICQKCPTNKR